MIEKELGISHNTINRGLGELEATDPSAVRDSRSQQRKEGKEDDTKVRPTKPD